MPLCGCQVKTGREHLHVTFLLLRPPFSFIHKPSIGKFSPPHPSISWHLSTASQEDNSSESEKAYHKAFVVIPSHMLLSH